MVGSVVVGVLLSLFYSQQLVSVAEGLVSPFDIPSWALHDGGVENNYDVFLGARSLKFFGGTEVMVLFFCESNDCSKNDQKN